MTEDDMVWYDRVLTEEVDEIINQNDGMAE